MHRFFGDIRRVDTEARMVYGYASTEQRAMDGKIITRDAMQGALDGYMEYANVREMHQPSAVGVCREATVDDTGLYIGAYVVDDVAWTKVKEGVYKAFSIGAKATAYDQMDRSIITEMELREISLVDRPSDPGAKIDIFHAADLDDEDAPQPTSQEAALPDSEDPEMSRAKPKADTPELFDTEIERTDPTPEANPTEGSTEPTPGLEETLPPVVEEPTPGSDDAGVVGEDTQPALDEPSAVDRAVQALSSAADNLEAIDRALNPEPEPAGDGLVLLVEAMDTLNIKRGLYGVSSLASLLSQLGGMIQDAAWEAEYEGDNSPVPAKLRDGLKTLAEGFKAMVKEEVDELLANVDASAGMDGALIAYAADSGDIERAAGAELTDEVHTALVKVLNTYIARGFKLPDPPEDHPLVQDLVQRTAERDQLLRSIEDTTTRITSVEARLAEVLAKVAPPRAAGGQVTRAVTKGDDAAGVDNSAAQVAVTETDVQRYLDSLSPEDRALELTKAALRRPSTRF